MNRNTIDQMQADQRVDDLDHKMEIYDGVKGTLKMCEIMILALDATTDKEYASRQNLINKLDSARQYALICACDIELEKVAIGK